MADDAETRNLDSMDELDFTGWNGADLDGAVTHCRCNRTPTYSLQGTEIYPCP